MSTALQEAKDPAEAATSNRVSSINPAKDIKMNEFPDSTTGAAAPEQKRALGRQLIDVEDMAGGVSMLIDALDMSISDINDSRQRDALRSFSDVIMDRMADLRSKIEAVRGELA